MPDGLKLIEVCDFKKTIIEGGGLAENMGVRKSYNPEIKVLDEKKLEVEMTISTGALDRDLDTIDPKGWNLKNYKKNPVVLYAHDHRSLPIGTSKKTWISDGKLKAIPIFTPADLNPLGYTVGRMVVGVEGVRYLNATSVGFNPFEWVLSDDEKRNNGMFPGVDFKKQELLEYSIVPVPSNPEALIEARSIGIDTKPIYDWAEKILDEWNNVNGIIRVPVSLDYIEEARKKADPKQKVIVPTLTIPEPEPVIIPNDKVTVPEPEVLADVTDNLLDENKEKQPDPIPESDELNPEVIASMVGEAVEKRIRKLTGKLD